MSIKQPCRPDRRENEELSGSLDQYMREVNRYPVLSRDQEHALAMKLRETGDPSARHQLVQANLRFVVKVAFQYKSYRLDTIDLIQEGNVGLMTAIERFDPDSGNRLLSYAVWWIKASIQAYISRSWALVRVLPSSQQRRILFGRHRGDSEVVPEGIQSCSLRSKAPKTGANLRCDRAENSTLSRSRKQERRARAERGEFEGWHRAANAARHYTSLDVSVMDEGRLTLAETLPSTGMGAEESFGIQELRQATRVRIENVRQRLSDAQRVVLDERILADSPATLQQLSDVLSISRERVRQVELTVKRKLERKLRPVMRAM